MRNYEIRRIDQCGKVRFPDRFEAESALAQARRWADNGNTERRERRIYLCPNCQGWHMTSKPLRNDQWLTYGPRNGGVTT